MRPEQDRTGSGKSAFHPASLDAVNFLLADVRGALGPYLNVFLVTQQGWSQSSVGVVTMIGGLLGLAVQTPIGAAIDATRAKRGVIVLALAVLACGAVAIFAAPTFWPVLAANAMMAIVGDVFGPAVAALTLGLFARAQLAGRMGRNGAFDHAGNVAIAAVAGIVGWLFGQRAVFLLVPVFAVLAAGAVLSIPGSAIDQERARGADTDTPLKKCSGWQAVFECRLLMVFALSAMLFHFANAPLLPLVGQKLALANKDLATAMMSSCIIAAQLVMLPIALFAGTQGGPMGPQAGSSYRVRHPAGTGSPLHAVGRQCLADRRPTAGWGRRGHLGCLDAACRRGPDARHRPLQSCPRRRGDGARRRGVAQRPGGRPDRRSFWLRRRIRDLGRGGSASLGRSWSRTARDWPPRRDASVARVDTS